MTSRMCKEHLSYRCGCNRERPKPAPRVVEEPDLFGGGVQPALFSAPTTPPSNGTATSEAAAASLDPKVLNDQHQRIMRALWRVRGKGLTDEEVQQATGLNPSSERPRRGELLTGGWVRDTGETRSTRSGRQATVWDVSEDFVRLVAANKQRKANEAA